MAKDKADAKETAVRDAAANLLAAINEAQAAGYAVTFPSRVEDLAAMQISETGAMRPDAQADGLTPVLVEGKPAFGDAPAPEAPQA